MWLEELVLLSPPQRPSGGLPKSPAVLNKGQSNGRQHSKTCDFSSRSPNESCNSEGAACRLIVAASLGRDGSIRCSDGINIRGRQENIIVCIDLISCVKEFIQCNERSRKETFEEF